jgi:DNA-binding transcriptional regulator YiaG
MTYPQRISNARIQLGLNSLEASRLWGFSPSTFYAWEVGTRNPAGLYRQKLERVLQKIENPNGKLRPEKRRAR